MEAKDKQRNTGSNTKLAAKILLSALAFIMFCIGLVLLVSPGKIWSGYVGVVNGLLLVLLVLAMFCIAVIKPTHTFSITKTKRIKVSIWLLFYSAAIISLFMANGWWKTENIDAIFNNDIIKSIGLYSEGNLAGKIFALIIAAIVIVLILRAINYILYKAIDNIKKESVNGETLADILIDKIFQRSSSSNKNVAAAARTSTLNENDNELDKNGEQTWKKWTVVGIIFAVVIVILIVAIVMNPSISNLISQQDDGITKTILNIFGFLISILASSFSIAIGVIAIGYVYRTIATILQKIKIWTEGGGNDFNEWAPGFLSWTISIAIVFWITESTSIDEIIQNFASKLSGIEPVKTFIAIIISLFVVWFLKEIIRIFIAAIFTISGINTSKNNEHAQSIINGLGNILTDLINIALDIISDTLSLAKIIPSFVKDISSLIDSGENNPDEIEEIIVKSKKIVLEKNLESESFHDDVNNYYADLYDEYIKNSKLTGEPTDNSDEKEPSEDNSSEEEN